jgi:ABC-type arginine transport system ATPase subunit
MRSNGLDDTVLVRLIPAYIYFTKSGNLDFKNLNNGVIIDGMRRLIDEDIGNALKQLKNWPKNEYTSILIEAPKTITELMLQESG